MFGNNSKKAPTAATPTLNGKPETIIGANTSIIGTLKSDGNIRIDGAVEGDIEILGNLIIGETGRVIATVKAQNVHVSGAVKGELTAVEQLEISPTGKVWGDITTAALHIEHTSYLASGRAIEFTRSIYRGDTYDFVAELRIGNPAEGRK